MLHILQNLTGKYYYLDKNGYILESSLAKPDVLLLKGTATDFENTPIGGCVDSKDLDKFGDIAKIIAGLTNNDITAKLSSLNIEDDANYILEFDEKQKTVNLGDLSDLSGKMSWINFFVEQNQEQQGTVHLEGTEVYFSPS